MSQYIHGTHQEEQARLARLNELINNLSLHELHLQGGERILDVGSGLGQLARAMARVAGPGKVVGIERSPEQLAQAKRLAQEGGEADLVEFRQGEATQLPLRKEEWGTFDLAHTRFLLEHLANPLDAVKAMVKAVRPGGRIILEDDGHDVMRLTPEPPGFGVLWNAYLRTYDRLGNDPYIGHRLVTLLNQAGATPQRNTWLFFGACQNQANFQPLVENLIFILVGARERILSGALLDDLVFDQTIASMEGWRQRPDAAIWYAISWAEGRR